MTKLVVHIGARKTATTFIQNALWMNQQRLAAANIYLPQAGRLDIDKRSIGHHHLAWAINGDLRFQSKRGGWDDLAAELDHRRPDVAFLTCEVFEVLLIDGDHPGGHYGVEFIDRLRSIGDDVVVVLVLRDWLAYMNSLYSQLVKMFAITQPFDAFLKKRIAAGAGNLFDHYRPLIEAPDIDFRLTTYDRLTTGDPLTVLLQTAGLDPPPLPDAPSDRVNTSLGAVGVEITRMVTGYLSGRHPDFSWQTPAARQLHRISATRIKQLGLNGDPYWGYDRPLAEKAATTVRPQLEALAQNVWGKAWDGELAVERPQCVARFDDFDPSMTSATVDHVRGMADRFSTLAGAHG